jgi:hypothetical protein
MPQSVLDDLPGAEQPLGDHQRADRVVGHDPAGVADHVRVTLVQAECAVDVEAGVHAGQHGDLLTRRHRQVSAGEVAGVGGVVGKQLIGDGHDDLLARCTTARTQTRTCCGSGGEWKWERPGAVDVATLARRP